MPVYYLESSALVKYYVTEPGSTWVRQVVDAEENVLVSAEITIAEVAAALGVITRMGRISRHQRDAFWEQFTRDLLQSYEFLPTRRTIITRAAALCLKHPLRGFDAIHLRCGAVRASAISCIVSSGWRGWIWRSQFHDSRVTCSPSAVDAHGFGKGVQLLASELRCGHASPAIEHVVPSSRA